MHMSEAISKGYKELVTSDNAKKGKIKTSVSAVSLLLLKKSYFKYSKENKFEDMSVNQKL